jgi:hypothetical protein
MLDESRSFIEAECLSGARVLAFESDCHCAHGFTQQEAKLASAGFRS